MSISMVNFYETFFPKPDLTIILGTPTYDDLHQMQLEILKNALSIHSNLGYATHGHIGLFMTNTKYAKLSNVLYVRTTPPPPVLY